MGNSDKGHFDNSNKGHMGNSNKRHMEDLCWLWLSMIPELTYRFKIYILLCFKNITKIWNANSDELRNIASLDPFTIKYLLNVKYKERAQKAYEAIIKKGIILLHPDQSIYPEGLKTIQDKPLILYCKGIPKEGEKAISVIGSRKASFYGLNAATTLSKQLASLGISIVSGMARGIDSAAHRAAIDVGGRTVAILGNGIDIAYPAENSKLMDKIAENGMVLSEFPLGTQPYDYNFPIRNRLISGFSLGTVVVEAALKSGTMITVNHAHSQGRSVFAVPGSIFSSNSQGTNKLLYDGAVVVTGIADILDELDLVRRPEKTELETGMGSIDNNNNENIKKMLPDERYVNVFDAIIKGTSHIDGICKVTGYPAELTGRLLVEMEIMGFLARHAGHYMVKDRS